MIVVCGACSAQNFVSTERLAVRAIPPRCWECRHPLPIDAGVAGTDGEIFRETVGSAPESNGDKMEKNRMGA